MKKLILLSIIILIFLIFLFILICMYNNKDNKEYFEDNNNNVICERAKIITYNLLNNTVSDNKLDKIKTSYGRIIKKDDNKYTILYDNGTTNKVDKKNVVIIPSDKKTIMGTKVMIDELKNGKWIEGEISKVDDKLPCIIHIKKLNGNMIKSTIDNVAECNKKELIYSKNDNVLVNYRNTGILKRGIVTNKNNCGYIIKFEDGNTEFVPGSLVN